MESVKLIECPRDAWQGLPAQIPTERKVEYLRALIDAGFRHIDAVSFVSPKAVPQMADSEQVLAQLGRVDGAEIIGIVVNEKGAERAIGTGAVTTLGFPYSISETFLRRNQNQSPEENRAVLKSMTQRAKGAGLSVVAYISMAFGNPYGDTWSDEAVAQAVRIISNLGVDAISLADTVGTAEPKMIHRVVSAVVSDRVGCEIGVHMHSTRAGAPAKVLAAYDAGCRRFDAAIGGLGGCPFAQDDLIGNIPTEEVLSALEQRGVELPVQRALTSVMHMNQGIAGEFAG
ncbi:MAG: Pyruvate:Oxaloacetate transcarboxylase domain protein [uncultured Chthoniobacterales bacterium]|uniref:Pyruvate:Oxaloacetate transcarboxylase domain protein n=1 Tax=uncultured Chthoniobacterales bacterium TaxID=1836801 RepID=A0A6J4J0P8_9BACT|nr:MAG: Pyruvate:Oxaloacetate transcarboxylase domain protein [uncultured Chthoniobacterales bacterium]